MTTFFADRGFVTINGVELANLKSVRWTIDEAISVVSTMSRNRIDAGFKKGNKKISGTMELEVPDTKAQIDLAFAYGQEVNVICTLGNGERHQLIGLVQNSQDLNGSVGETSKTINFMALNAVNENGPAVNSDIGL